jgi:hypothetical protein
MAVYQRRPRQSPVALILIVVAVVVLGVVLALALSGPRQGGDRSSPEPVSNRVMQALQRNDMRALYEEMSPSLKEIFTLEALMTGEQSVVKTQGRITNVEVLEPPTVKTGPEWNGEWAEARVRITRQTTTETYLVRFHMENGQWWFFGTLKVE